MIKPTIGCKVWYIPELTERVDVFDRKQPLDATVIYVGNDGAVSLSVIDHGGHVWTRHNVQLLQAGDAAPNGSYAMWPTNKHEENTQ
jgi:hypothetical protein